MLTIYSKAEKMVTKTVTWIAAKLASSAGVETV
jgi:hypothetical protein